MHWFHGFFVKNRVSACSGWKSLFVLVADIPWAWHKNFAKEFFRYFNLTKYFHTITLLWVTVRSPQFGKIKKFSLAKKISSNQLFSKNVIFTKFLSKKCNSKFPQFPHLAQSLSSHIFGKNLISEINVSTR